MDDNKVKVVIYGTEYVISGDRDKEIIREVASYVDNKMREMGRAFSTNIQGSLGVLTAVNIADELFEDRDESLQLKKDNAYLEKELDHYKKMCDDEKKSHVRYQEELAAIQKEKEEIREEYNKLEEKCKEFESSYFDLKMENVQLKSQLEKYKKNESNF